MAGAAAHRKRGTFRTCPYCYSVGEEELSVCIEDIPEDEPCLTEIAMHSCAGRSHGFRDRIGIKDRPSSPVTLKVRVCLLFQRTIWTKG